MASEKLAVNLIPKEETRRKSWEKFLKWVLTYGRYIIIGTEVILLTIFAIRFKFDRELGDLSDATKSKQVLIESFGNLELETHYLQTHLSNIKTLQKQEPNSTRILDSLALLTPQDVVFSQLGVSSSDITLGATAYSLEGFAAFLEGLKRSPKFENISLDKLNQGRLGIEFALKFKYRGK